MERTTQRRRNLGCVIAALLVALLGAGIAGWALWPARETHPWIRVRTAPPNVACDAVDLELELQANRAHVRTWTAMPGIGCKADVFVVPLTPRQRARAQRAGAEVGSPKIPIIIAFGERRDGMVTIESVSETGFRRRFKVQDRLPPGTSEIEALYRELVAAGPARASSATASSATASSATAPSTRPNGGIPGAPRPTLAPPTPGALPIRAADPRRADVTEIVASLEPDALGRAPGAYLESFSATVLPDGSIDLLAGAVFVTFENATTSLSYAIRGGAASPPTVMGATVIVPGSTSRCSSRDLFGKGTAAGMGSATDHIALVLAPRAGGATRVWQLTANGRRVATFDAERCTLLRRG